MNALFHRLSTDPKPVVESSFMTEFYDHIKVAMDAEVILFLHDLVSSYIKEKDKGERPKCQCWRLCTLLLDNEYTVLPFLKICSCHNRAEDLQA